MSGRDTRCRRRAPNRWRAALALATCVLAPAAPCASDGILLDGFDVDLGLAWFVSNDGSDANPGTAAAPFATVGRGIAAAVIDASKKNVVVAGGVYPESVTLVNGVSLYGEYTPGSFVRAAGNYSVIRGVSSSGNHDRAVVAVGIGSAAVFDRFVVYGPFNAKAGGNSYAIYVSGSGAGLQITNNVIVAGHGGPGASGADGVAGTAGVDGAGRSLDTATTDLQYDAFVTSGATECNSSNNRQRSNGAKLNCGATAVDGGNGGGNQCPVMSACTSGTSSGCITVSLSKFSAIDGFNGLAGGANGGSGGSGDAGGVDLVLYNASSGQLCYVPTGSGPGNNTSGLDGADGTSGGNASAGIGCSNAAGAVAGGNWIGGSASGGGNAGNGGGGGGGGAGAGARCNPGSPSNCSGGHDYLGGHGGGGGSGGCGGSGGGAGGAGGGAFGVFIVGGAAPVVTGNRILGGIGGRGGRGGYGARGGPGGVGGLGGSTGVPALFCSDAGGRGGDGGAGGIGGGGGGGCGGASFAIYTSGIGSPSYCADNLVENGIAGAGGSGGLSLGNSAGAGQNGTLAACSFH